MLFNKTAYISKYNWRYCFAIFVLIAIVLGFVVPVFAMFSFVPNFEYFLNVVAEPYTIEIIKFSLLQAGLSTIISVAIAMLLVSALHRRKFTGKPLYLLIISVPVVMPVVLASAAFVFIYGSGGVVERLSAQFGFNYRYSPLGLIAIVAVHVFFNAPLALRIFLQCLDNVPQNYWRLAQTFGWNSRQLFYYIEWPAIKSALLSVSVLIFLLCFTAFSSVLLLSSTPLQATLEVAIYQSLQYDTDFIRVASYGLLQLLICFFIYALIARHYQQGTILPSSKKVISRGDENNVLLKCTDTILLILFFIYCASPLVFIISSIFNTDGWQVFSRSGFYNALSTSVIIALLAALLATVMGYLLAYLQNQIEQVAVAQNQLSDNKPNAKSLSRSLSLFLLNIIPKFNLVVPAIMFVASIFLIYGSTIIPGSFLLLLVLNALWVIPFVMRLVSSNYNQVNYYQKLSSSLSLTGYAHWRYIEWPLLKKNIGLAAAIAMAFSLGDFSVVAVINHDGLVTLPMYMYQLMSGYQMAEAQLVAFVIALLIIIAFVVFYSITKTPKNNMIEKI